MNIPRHVAQDIAAWHYFGSLPKEVQSAVRLRWGKRIVEWFYSSEMMIPDGESLRESGADKETIELANVIRRLKKEKETI